MPIILSSVPVVRVRFVRAVNNLALATKGLKATPTVRRLTVPGQHGFIDLDDVTSQVDPDTGVAFFDLVATDDPDVNETFGWTITGDGWTGFSRTVQVPQTGSIVETITVQGASRPAVWLNQLADFTGASGPTGPDTATRTYVDDSLDNHEDAPDPHPQYALDTDVAGRLLPSSATDGQTIVRTGGAWAAGAASGGGGGGGGIDAETVRDLIGTSLTAGYGLTKTVDDAGDTTTLAVSGLSKGDVGLNNVNNTADANKPVSSATQAALDAKANTASLAPVATSGSAADLTTGVLDDARIPASIARDSEIQAAIDALIGGAPGPRDTLKEINDALSADEGALSALTSTVAGKTDRLTQRTSTATTSTTATANEVVPLDTSGGTLTLTGPGNGAPFGARWKVGTAAPTIAAPSGYTINGAASISMGLAPGGSSGELVVWQAFGTDYQPVNGFKPQSALDSRMKLRRYHTTRSPLSSLPQYSSARVVCGVDAASGKLWSYNSAGLYQVDALTSGAWSTVTLPPNCTLSGAAAKVIAWTPPSGVASMFALLWNSSAAAYQVYSAPLGPKGTAPTWTGPLLSLSTNAVIIPTAFRLTSTGLLVGEYTGTPDVSGGPSIYRSTDGATFTRVLGPLSTVRHLHGIYEDPFNLGTIYAAVGDFFSPYAPPSSIYRSLDGGATFAPVTALAHATWQAVGMGFTADWVWGVSDQANGAGPWIADRATLTPRWATTKGRHDSIAVPGAAGGRYIADLVLTSGSTTVTSATASFTSFDVGRRILGPNALPNGSYIVSVTNATTAVVSSAANGSGTVSARIDGDTFYANAYAGATDPATGWLYVVANDASAQGNVAGLFVLTGPDEPWTLLYTLPLSGIGNHEVFIAGGYLWISRYGPWPLLTAA